MFQPSPKDDSFYVELAAATIPDYPFQSTLSAKIGDPALPARTRLPRLWSTERFSPTWWLVKDTVREGYFSYKQPGVSHIGDWYEPPIEEVLPNVQGIVGNALEMLETHGIPHFKRLADLTGVDGDSIFSDRRQE
jgi:hypothetical protein